MIEFIPHSFFTKSIFSAEALHIYRFPKIILEKILKNPGYAESFSKFFRNVHIQGFRRKQVKIIKGNSSEVKESIF